MIEKLPEPLLGLQLSSLLSTQNNIDISTIWNVFTKCKDSLENGHRLENLSWRLWHEQTRTKKKSELSRLAAPMKSDLPKYTPKSKQLEASQSLDERDQEITVFHSSNSSLPLMPLFKGLPPAGPPKEYFSLKLAPSLSSNSTDLPISDSKSYIKPACIPAILKQSHTLITLKPPTTLSRPIIAAPASKTTFFISGSSNQSSMDTDTDLDSDSDLDSLYSDFSDENIECPIERSLFEKQTLPLKRPSLLSVALQRTAFRNSQSRLMLLSQSQPVGLGAQPSTGLLPSSGILTTPHPMPESMPTTVDAPTVTITMVAGQEDLTPSLRENLVWDHMRPFNTLISHAKKEIIPRDESFSPSNLW